MKFSPGRIERERRRIAEMAEEGLSWQCALCDGEDPHLLGCPLFHGEVTVENLTTFLFQHSNAGSDGPRIMNMMEDMAKGLVEKLGLSAHKPGADDLWTLFMGPAQEPHHCGLCGNSGVVDTRGKVQTAAGFECGVAAFCICPNGRAMKRRGVDLASAIEDKERQRGARRT